MTVARSGHSATLLPDGRVFIAGGARASTSAEIYDHGPKPTKPIVLPASDRVRLDISQGTTPTRPPAAKSDPKYSIDGGQNRALPFSLEGCELEAECGILESDGLVTAHQQPEETEGK